MKLLFQLSELFKFVLMTVLFSSMATTLMRCWYLFCSAVLQGVRFTSLAVFCFDTPCIRSSLRSNSAIASSLNNRNKWRGTRLLRLIETVQDTTLLCKIAVKSHSRITWFTFVWNSVLQITKSGAEPWITSPFRLGQLRYATWGTDSSSKGDGVLLEEDSESWQGV